MTDAKSLRGITVKGDTILISPAEIKSWHHSLASHRLLGTYSDHNGTLTINLTKRFIFMRMQTPVEIAIGDFLPAENRYYIVCLGFNQDLKIASSEEVRCEYSNVRGNEIDTTERESVSKSKVTRGARVSLIARHKFSSWIDKQRASTSHMGSAWLTPISISSRKYISE